MVVDDLHGSFESGGLVAQHHIDARGRRQNAHHVDKGAQHVACRYDSYQLSIVDDRHPTDFMIVNEHGRQFDIVIGADRDRVFDHQIIQGHITQHIR